MSLLVKSKLTGLGIDRQQGFNRYSPIVIKQLKKDLSHLNLVLLTKSLYCTIGIPLHDLP